MNINMSSICVLESDTEEAKAERYAKFIHITQGAGNIAGSCVMPDTKRVSRGMEYPVSQAKKGMRRKKKLNLNKYRLLLADLASLCKKALRGLLILVAIWVGVAVLLFGSIALYNGIYDMGVKEYDYAEIVVMPGDTLWDYAVIYADELGMRKDDYISRVCHENGLSGNDNIYAYQTLSILVPTEEELHASEEVE